MGGGGELLGGLPGKTPPCPTFLCFSLPSPHGALKQEARCAPGLVPESPAGQVSLLR